MVINNYLDLVASKNKFPLKLKPHSLIVKLVNELQKNSTILDLGCGEGKDSVYLAKKGFKVTAVDFSKESIHKTKQLAEQNDLNIKTVNSKIKSFLEYHNYFDAIVCINSLQFIDQKEIKETVDLIKSRTNQNGFNVISSFVAQNEIMKKKAKWNEIYLFDKGELKKIYQNWKIIFYEEKLGAWESHGGKPHKHYIVNLIAQKNIPKQDDFNKLFG